MTYKTENNVIPYKVLKEAAFIQLRKAILEGKYVFGQKISEQDVAKEMGISRGPVREALIALERDGLVENIPQKGAYVIEMNTKDIEEIYTLRANLERMAVGLIINKLDSTDIDIWERLVEEMGILSDQNDTQGVIECELNFHESICFLSEHKRLLRAWQQMRGPIQMLLAASDIFIPHEEQSQVQHQHIIDVIMEGNCQKAKDTIEEHIMTFGRRLVNYFQQKEEAR